MNIETTVLKAYEVRLILNSNEATILSDMLQNPITPDENADQFALRHHLYNELKKILKG